MKKYSASISPDGKNSSFQLNSHTQFQKFTQRIQTKLTEWKKETAWSQ